MGNPTFYWFPYPCSSHLETLDLGEGLGELSTSWQVSAQDGTAITGKSFRSTGLQRQSITISRDRMSGGSSNTSEEMAHKFASLQNHLDRGYSVGFSVDSDKSWIAPIVNNHITGGTTNLTVGNHPFRDITGAKTPADGDFFAIESDSPNVIYEVHKKASGSVSAFQGGEITFADNISFSVFRKAFCRWYRYWPCLRRPVEEVGQNIVTNESGLLWNLSLRLVADTSILFRFHDHTGFSEFVFPGDPSDMTLNAPFDGGDGYDLLDFIDPSEFNQIDPVNDYRLSSDPRFWWTN